MAKELRDRGATVDVIDSFKNVPMTPDTIAIFHEFISSNYLNSNYPVTYVLGDWTQGGQSGPKPIPSEVKFYYHDRFITEEYKQSAKRHYLLAIDVIDYGLFNLQYSNDKKFNVCYRGKGDGAILNTLQLDDKIFITNEFPATRPEVAYLLKKAKFLWTTDANSLITSEARLCGTPVIFVPNWAYSEDDVAKFQKVVYGMAKNTSVHEIDNAIKTLPLFKPSNDKVYGPQKGQIDEFLRITQELA